MLIQTEFSWEGREMFLLLPVWTQHHTSLKHFHVQLTWDQVIAGAEYSDFGNALAQKHQEETEMGTPWLPSLALWPFSASPVHSGLATAMEFHFNDLRYGFDGWQWHLVLIKVWDWSNECTLTPSGALHRHSQTSSKEKLEVMCCWSVAAFWEGPAWPNSPELCSHFSC